MTDSGTTRRTPPVQVRVDEATAAWWRTLAEREGCSVGELVRRAVAATYSTVTSPGPSGSRSWTEPRPAPVADGYVAVPCSKSSLHRSGSFCRYCGQTP